MAQMLAKYGVRQARVEMNWGNTKFEDENIHRNPKVLNSFEAKLLALKKYGIRPLILLNAHQGAPCPVKFFERTMAADANAGDIKIQLNNVSELKIGYSGISNLTDYWAAEILITNISGNTVTLSKPLPNSIKAGESVKIATLKYRPFSVPGSKDYQNTIAGWKSYVGTVAKFATEVLGTTKSFDKGFDLEIWNELTFGSKFLYINEYYAQDVYNYKENSIWSNLVEETANYVEKHSDDFQGVKITNGFANTIPWPASSQQPARINAISKHPYRDRNNYPQDEVNTQEVNAIGNIDNTFVPTYSTLFPEYFGTAIKTETLVRDMGPLISKVHGIDHGRYARGSDDPVPVWITEVNILPKRIDPNITVENALAVKAKTTARYLCFYLNKGARRVYLYDAVGGDTGWGIVKQRFLDYSEQNTLYPHDDRDYTSPALQTIERTIVKMSEKLERNLTKTRSLEVVSISDTHNNYQFKGDGSKAHPNLYDRDVFAFLPFQVNAKRFVIPYYVMTRDIAKTLKPEKFTVKVKGIEGDSLVTAYDPIEDTDIPVTVKTRKTNSLTLEMTATDYPYLLTVQEL